jgi:hypothetical protein
MSSAFMAIIGLRPMLHLLHLHLYRYGAVTSIGDWAALASKLSSSASLIDTSYDDYADQCMPEFTEPSPTNHALIDQPSGMCLPHLFFGWEMSSPRPSENCHLDQTYDQLFQDLIYVNPPADLESWILDPTNPSLDLPYKVLFPVVASDVLLQQSTLPRSMNLKSV